MKVIKNLKLIVLLITILFLLIPVSGTSLTVIPQGGSFYYGQNDVDLTSTILNGTSMICWWDSYGLRGTPRFHDCMYMQGQNPADWYITGVLLQFRPGEYYADAAMNAIDPSIYTLTFKVIKRPTPVSSFSTDTTSGPAPLTVQLNDTSSNLPDQWLWDFGDGTTSYSQNITHTYSISGVYSVTMQAGNQYAIPPRDLDPAKTIITVLSPLDPNAVTTSLTTAPSQITTTTPAPITTITIATTTMPKTVITTVQTTVLTTASSITTSANPITTQSPTRKATIKIPSPLPTDTPTEPSPMGIEAGIIATIGSALLVMKRR